MNLLKSWSRSVASCLAFSLCFSFLFLLCSTNYSVVRHLGSLLFFLVLLKSSIFDVLSLLGFLIRVLGSKFNLFMILSFESLSNVVTKNLYLLFFLFLLKYLNSLLVLCCQKFQQLQLFFGLFAFALGFTSFLTFSILILGGFSNIFKVYLQ